MSFRTKWSPLLLVCVALVAPHAALAQAVSTSPGRSAVFASEAGDALGFIEFLATIEKAKRRQILKMDVFYSLYGGACGNAVQACISVVTVNDLPVHPSSFGACSPCSVNGCTVSGTFWFDPEASGQVGQPLDIRVVLADGGNECPRSMRGSLAASLVKP